jgi:hypothetical protein
MRHKFKIILPDRSVFKPKKNQMIIMNTEGIVFLSEYFDYAGWYIQRLSAVIPAYEVRFLPKTDEFGL